MHCEELFYRVCVPLVNGQFFFHLPTFTHQLDYRVSTPDILDFQVWESPGFITLYECCGKKTQIQRDTTTKRMKCSTLNLGIGAKFSPTDLQNSFRIKLFLRHGPLLHTASFALLPVEIQTDKHYKMQYTETEIRLKNTSRE